MRGLKVGGRPRVPVAPNGWQATGPIRLQVKVALAVSELRSDSVAIDECSAVSDSSLGE